MRTISKSKENTTNLKSIHVALKNKFSLDDKSQLQQLFEDELKNIYWVEKSLLKSIPEMIKKATSEELVTVLDLHLSETQVHVSRLEQIFEMIGKDLEANKCESMARLLKEGDELIKECNKGVMRDAGIIITAQKVEHYEIATYGSLRTFATTLGFDDVASLMEQTLNEEKTVDEKLTEVAESSINIEAAIVQ